MRADDTVVGLVAVLRAAVWAGAPGTTLLADTAVRAVDTVARDDMDVVEEADEVDETLPVALVAPALLGAAAERETAVDVVGTPVLPRVERNWRAFAAVGGATVAVRTPTGRVGRVALPPILAALTSSRSAATGSRWCVLV